MIPITLSVVIPAYNEAAFIGTLLDRIQAVDLAGDRRRAGADRRRRRVRATTPPTSPSATAACA